MVYTQIFQRCKGKVISCCSGSAIDLPAEVNLIHGLKYTRLASHSEINNNRHILYL